MNHPNVPVPESRPRRTRFLPAFQLTVVLAAVVLTAPFAAALTSEPPRASNPGGITGEIMAAQKKVADLQKQLHTYQDQMASLKAQEPQDPGPSASPSDKKKYANAHSSWQQRVNTGQQLIDSISAQLVDAEANLKRLKAQAAEGGH
jgi:hypothetical protein